MQARAVAMIGDTLLSSAFVSYIGAFGATFRDQLTNEAQTPLTITLTYFVHVSHSHRNPNPNP